MYEYAYGMMLKLAEQNNWTLKRILSNKISCMQHACSNFLCNNNFYNRMVGVLSLRQCDGIQEKLAI